MTTLLLLRLRYQLVTSGRTNRLLLAEEATAVAFAGLGTEPVALADQALALLEQAASSDIDTDARLRQIDNAHNRLPGYTSAIEAFAQTRAEALSYDHIRLTEAAGGGATVRSAPSFRPTLSASMSCFRS
jgi:hypothetical protein